MKRLFTTVTAALFALALCGAEVAVLFNGDGKSKNEFATPIAELGWAPDFYSDKPEDMAKFDSVAGKYEFVIASSLFCYRCKEKFDVAGLKKWIEDGGFFVITDGTYREIIDMLGRIDPKLSSGLVGGKCTSSQWQVNGFASNVEPAHTLRSFPNRLTDPDSWPHFEEIEGETPWRTIVRCSEGKPLMFFTEYGKGAILLSALRQQTPKNIENYYVYSQLRKCGLDVKRITLDELRPGKGSIAVELAKPAPAGMKFVYEVKDAYGVADIAEVPLAGISNAADFKISCRGDVTVKLAIADEKGERILSTRKALLPELVEVGTVAYRGLLSAARRLDEIRLPVKVSPDSEDIAGAKVSLSIANAGGAVVGKAEYALPAEGSRFEGWYKVPFAATNAVGVYTVKLEVESRDGVSKPFKASATNSFEVLPVEEAQCVIDEDQTFLVNGKPFFPLGIYHVRPYDFERVGKIGFNTMQFWSWHVNDGISQGVPTSMYKAFGNGMRCLFEARLNHAEYYSKHPGMLMWYVADEPTEGMEKQLRDKNDHWHNADHNHPTFVASCRPDLFRYHARFADVFAMDPYGDEEKMIKWCRLAEKEILPHQPVIVIPWADTKDEGSDCGEKLIPLQAWTAVAHGARGIIWYCWTQLGGGPKDVGLGFNEQNQAVMKKLIADFNKVMPALTAVDRRTFEEGPLHCYLANGKPKQRYLIVVNTSKEKVTADIAVPELKKTSKVFLPLEQVPRKDKDGNVKKTKTGEIVTMDGELKIPSTGNFAAEIEPMQTIVWRW